MITPMQARFDVPWARYADAWAVYEHWINPDPLNAAMPASRIYVGVCRLRDIGFWPDAQRNTEWGPAVNAEPTMLLSCVIVALCDSEPEARNERMRYLSTLPHRPICNLRGSTIRGNTLPVVCNETGLQYNSVSEAARALGVSQPAISNHLNKRPRL